MQFVLFLGCIWVLYSCITLIFFTEACSHGRAYKFFAESIYNKEPKFVSYGADSWRAFRDGNFSINTVLMGEYVKRTARGRYYLYTGAEPKFALSDCLSKCGDNCCENNET